MLIQVVWEPEILLPTVKQSDIKKVVDRLPVYIDHIRVDTRNADVLSKSLAIYKTHYLCKSNIFLTI